MIMIIVILIHILLIGTELLRYFRFKDKSSENTVTAPYEAMRYSPIFLSLLLLTYPGPSKLSFGPLSGSSTEIITVINICVAVSVWLCNGTYFRRKIVYDEEGFTYTDALGREKRYSYGDAFGVTENPNHTAVTVFLKERSIRINGGYQAVLGFTAQAKRGYKKATGRTLKAVLIRGKRGKFEENRLFTLLVLAIVGYTLFTVVLGLLLRLTPLSSSELEYVTLSSYDVALDRGHIVVSDNETKRKYDTFYYSDDEEAEALETIALMDGEEPLTIGYLEYYRRSGRGRTHTDYHIFTASSDSENGIITLEETDGSRIAVNRRFMMIFAVPTAVYVIFLATYSTWYGVKKRSLVKYLRTCIKQ